MSRKAAHRQDDLNKLDSDHVIGGLMQVSTHHRSAKVNRWIHQKDDLLLNRAIQVDTPLKVGNLLNLHNGLHNPTQGGQSHPLRANPGRGIPLEETGEIAEATMFPSHPTDQLKRGSETPHGAEDVTDDPLC